MFSIICCSVKETAAAALERNISATIGVPFEFIVFDNRTVKYGLSKVYNLCAAKAKYDLLCFVHEDVEFVTEGWGALIARRLDEPECGVIGFAGGTFKSAALSSWCVTQKDVRQNYSQPGLDGRMRRYYTNPEGADFSPAVCLDGFCLMVRKEVWRQTPFDEVLLTGFHAYDMDFTTAVACNHKNWVCNCVEIHHFSRGNYSPGWLAAQELYHAKWRSHLPIFAEERPSPRQVAVLERGAEAAFLKMLFKKHLYGAGKELRLLTGYIRRNPGRVDSWKLMLKYLKYGVILRRSVR